MTAERRKNERISVTRDYYYFPGEENNKIECMLKNISITGSCILSKNNINKNDIIFLHIGGKKEIVLQAKVVWKMGDQYGLLFLLDNSQDFDNISYIMNYELLNINK
ncbi:MAG: PilZ domain-containing protein [Spirochaetota bacterium]|nr:PilZ domain-containing protein [Spirochaetota bacterium]